MQALATRKDGRGDAQAVAGELPARSGVAVLSAAGGVREARASQREGGHSQDVVATRIYVAGPMSGLPESNYPAFNAVAAQLRALGFEVENPAENPAPACGSWLGYMRMAIRQLSHCDAIMMLPGWSESRGARIEYRLACDLGLHVHLWDVNWRPA